MAAAGIFNSYVIVGSNFYNLNGAGNPTFQGASLGAFAPNGSLLLGGQLRSFKDNGTDVTGASIFYAIYPVANRPTSPTFTEISYAFQFNTGTNSDQQWGTDINGSNGTNLAINILLGPSRANGTYTLEVYARITTNGVNAAGEIFDSNNSSNYLATFSIDASLPVRLSSFTGEAKSAYNELAWVTAQEENNAYFNIERSTDARQWEPLGRVAGSGNSASQQAYRFQDRLPYVGTTYYRLQQVDYDGQFAYYGPVVIDRKPTAAEVRVFPNPAKDLLFIQIENGNVGGQISLSNSIGQQLRAWPASEATNGLSVAGLPKGVYLLRWVSGDAQNPRPLYSSRLIIN